MVLSSEDPQYRQCTVTVMDNIADPQIRFDDQGVCNYVHEYHQHYPQNIPDNPKQKLEELIDAIKKEGKNKPYDCLTGISGGVDSSYLIYKAKEWGLRPLIVHFDNGWNTEIAVRNINNIINKTGFKLFTLVVNWEEFRDLQLSYIKAGVVDLEVPTDHAIYATWLQLAKKFKIKYVLNGNNYPTEAIMPSSWIYTKSDAVNLLNIHKQFGTRPLKTYPVVKPLQQLLYNNMLNITVVKPLNLINYNKGEAKKKLMEEFDWRDYGGKHYESFYTKFYQAYILPEKFRIDKRKPHLSNLILSKQISKDQALQELQQPLYDATELKNDTEYFIKKMNMTEEFFAAYLKAPRVDHKIYGRQGFLKDQYPVLKLLRPVYKMLKRNRK
jgi:N-acetyl sugar amidotransferase